MLTRKISLKWLRPGISIIIGLLTAEFILYLFLPLTEILAVMATTFAAFVIGYVDDRKIMGGWFKIIALTFCCNPNYILWNI